MPKAVMSRGRPSCCRTFGTRSPVAGGIGNSEPAIWRFHIGTFLYGQRIPIAGVSGNNQILAALVERIGGNGAKRHRIGRSIYLGDGGPIVCGAVGRSDTVNG